MPRSPALASALCLLAFGLAASEPATAARLDGADLDYERTRRQLRQLEHQLGVERQRHEALQAKARTLDAVTERSQRMLEESRSGDKDRGRRETAVTENVVELNRKDADGADRAVTAQAKKVAELEQRVAALRESLASSDGREDRTARLRSVETWLADNRARRGRGEHAYDLDAAVAAFAVSLRTTAKGLSRIREIDIQVKIADQAAAVGLGQERQRLQEDLARQEGLRQLLTLRYHQHLLLTMALEDPAGRPEERSAARLSAQGRADAADLQPALDILRRDRGSQLLSEEGAAILRNGLVDGPGCTIQDPLRKMPVAISPRLYNSVLGRPAPPSLAMCADWWLVQQPGDQVRAPGR